MLLLPVGCALNVASFCCAPSTPRSRAERLLQDFCKEHPFGAKSHGPQPQPLPQASKDLKLDLLADLLPNLRQAALQVYICSKVKDHP